MFLFTLYGLLGDLRVILWFWRSFQLWRLWWSNLTVFTLQWGLHCKT